MVLTATTVSVWKLTDKAGYKKATVHEMHSGRVLSKDLKKKYLRSHHTFDLTLVTQTAWLRGVAVCRIDQGHKSGGHFTLATREDHHFRSERDQDAELWCQTIVAACKCYGSDGSLADEKVVAKQVEAAMNLVVSNSPKTENEDKEGDGKPGVEWKHLKKDIIMEGVVEKKQKTLGVWKKRYLVLTHNTVEVRSGENDRSHYDSFLLGAITCNRQSGEKHSTHFDIVDGKNQHHFRTTHDDEAAAWSLAVRTAIEAQAQPFQRPLQQLGRRRRRLLTQPRMPKIVERRNTYCHLGISCLKERHCTRRESRH